MCGIAGFLSPLPLTRITLEKMSDSIKWRGSDGKGLFFDKSEGVGIVHRRLSIIDLSNQGKQPMTSLDGRWVISFNGEIYNHLKLRKEIDSKCSDYCWRGTSDTETLLYLIQVFGLNATLKKINGMFAFSLWDKKKKELTLVRDRIGEKPLYYGSINSHFVFSSNLSAFKSDKSWKLNIDRDALGLFMRYNYVPCPRSIYKEVSKLKPGHYIVIKNKGRSISNPVQFYSLEKKVEFGLNNQLNNYSEILESVDSLITDSVKIRMTSDVPVGAFLSGGYDSSMIAAKMQSVSSKPIKTFSMGNPIAKYNEGSYAKEISKHLGTIHTNIDLSPEEGIKFIPQIPMFYDEPFADSSQIPTLMISEIAKSEVKVILSGDGGDELFGGYNRHIFAPYLWNKIKMIPKPVRNLISKIYPMLQEMNIERLNTNSFLSRRYVDFETKVSKIFGSINSKNQMDFYNNIRSHYRDNNIVMGSRFDNPFNIESINKLSFLNQILFHDMTSYLPDDILTKVDRASMGLGIEARVPFLDHRLIELIWRVSEMHKVNGKQGKVILKSLVHSLIPENLLDRPKQGFSIPTGNWLRGPLRDWGESLLNESKLRQEGFLNHKIISKLWAKHQEKTQNNEHFLWSVLMFEAWLNYQ